MKRKHHGVMVICVSLAAVAAIGVYAGSGLWQRLDLTKRTSRRTTLQIKVPSGKQVEQMESLYDRMPVLAAPAKRQVAGKKLWLFGYQGDRSAGDGGEEADQVDLAQTKFKLSLIIMAGFHNYCIVEGRFMSEGAWIDEDTRVLKIESHRVLIARNSERRWIYLEDQTASPMIAEPEKMNERRKGPS